MDLFLPPLERIVTAEQASIRRLSLESAGFASNKSIRRIISYDALKPPDETIEEYGGVTPYHVSTARRVSVPLRCIRILLTGQSGRSNRCYGARMLVREWHCVRLRSAEAHSHQRRRFS